MKCIFGVFTSFQKTNKNESKSSKFEFVRSFFGRNVGSKKSFRICLTFSTAVFKASIPIWSPVRKFIRSFTIAKGARVVIVIIFKLKGKDIFYHPVSIIVISWKLQNMPNIQRKADGVFAEWSGQACKSGHPFILMFP